MATIKQKKAFKAVVNGSTLTEGMKLAKYAPTTVARTNKLTRTKGWLELMEKHLPDSLLAKKHREGLDATTKKPHLIDRDDKGRPVYEYVPEDDFAVRHRYLETAYKIKHKISDEPLGEGKKMVVAIQVVINGHNPEDRTDGKAVVSA